MSSKCLHLGQWLFTTPVRVPIAFVTIGGFVRISNAKAEQLLCYSVSVLYV